MKATLFDIKEFSVRDGEGIRTTIFFKGCPLRCTWCHNPEGLSAFPELYELIEGCLACNLCRKACNHPDCQAFGRCLHVCPKNLQEREVPIYVGNISCQRCRSNKCKVVYGRTITELLYAYISQIGRASCRERV